MILKKVFHPLRVARYLRTELCWAAGFSLAVFGLYEGMQLRHVALPFSVAVMLGSALAIFLAFRNNSAYGRWWEARTLWGGIVNNSRIFARQIIANTEFAVNTGKATPEQAAAFQAEMIYRQVAFAHTLRLQLRGQQDPDAYRHLLAAPEYIETITKANRPNHLLLSQGRRIKEGIRLEWLGAFDNISLEPTLAGFSQYQGACERIKNTPLLRQYHFFTRLFLFVFMAVLPAALMSDFSRMGAAWLMIPVSIVIAFVFGVMGKVGEINEDPFENRITDIPLTAICNTIERDLREMLGERDLPPRAVPSDGILF